MTTEPEMTLCPTCGYHRETFQDKDGTSGFVPHKPKSDIYTCSCEAYRLEIERQKALVKELVEALEKLEKVGTSKWKDLRELI